MNPAKCPRENLIDVFNSTRQEQATGDIESGPNAASATAQGTGGSLPTTQSAKYAEDVFGELYETIHDREKNRSHIDSEKRAVYKRLMDRLDDVEERHPKSTFSLVSVEFFVLSGLTTALACTLTLEKMKHHRFLWLRMWQWVTMVLMIASGLSVVRFVTFVVLWPVKRWWRIHKYVVFFTRQLKRCLDVTLWFCIVLLGWYMWFRPRLKHVHGELSIVVAHQVTRFLIALCLGSFLWLLKNVLYLKLEADLHYDQFFDRLQQTVVYLHGIQILHTRGMWKFLTDNKSKKKLLRMPNSRRNNEKEAAAAAAKEKMKGWNIWMEVLAMEKESAPIWILRRLAEEYLDQVKHRPLQGTGDHIREDKKILREAKKLFTQLISKRIDINDPVHHLSDQEVKREDLKEYDLKDEELDVIFKYSNKKEEEEDEEDGEIISRAKSSTSLKDRTIGHDEFLNWAVRAYKNCWGLELTLLSSKSVFIKLNRLLSIFLLTVMLIVWLLLSEIVNTGQLALLFTPFVAASFIFGDSCRKMFEGLIFAFAMHPFDVGDRVIINNAQMRVKELNILTTIFYKYDTGEEVITPNSTLTTTSIINLDITPDQSDKVEFVLSPLTPLEDIKDLEIKIKKLLDEDIEYSSNSKVVKSEVGKEETKMTVYFKYLVSYLTAEVKALHKSKIFSMIMKLQKDMKINNKEYPPSYKPYIVEIELACKLKMEHLEVLRSEMLRDLERDSKVVIMELTKSRIKMGLYVGKEEDVENIEEDKPETRPKMTVMEIVDVEGLSERLKSNKVVNYVKILQAVNNGKYDVITEGGKKWGSFKATDVIQSEPDHQSTSLEKIPSEDHVEKTTEGSNGDRFCCFWRSDIV